MKPEEMTIFQLVDLLESDKAAALREMTLRFRRAAGKAAERARALGLPAYDGRAGEPLPPEENWEGVPIRRGKRSPTMNSTNKNVQSPPQKTNQKDGMPESS